jgi:hypothetical protein
MEIPIELSGAGSARLRGLFDFLDIPLLDETDGIGVAGRFHFPLNNSTFGYGNRFAGNCAVDSGGFAYFDTATGNDIAFDRSGNYYARRTDRPLPKSAYRDGQRSRQVTLSFDFAANQKISVTRNNAGNLAAFIDKGCRSGRFVLKTTKS